MASKPTYEELEQKVWKLEEEATEYKQTEQALRLERDKLQKYLDVAGAIIVVIGAKQKVSLINRRGCEVLGYEANEIQGKNWFDNFLPERIKEDLRSGFIELMAAPQKDIKEIFEDGGENPILTKSGKERIIAWRNTVLKDEEGNITATMSSGQDVTEARRAEKALRESENNYRTLLENIPQKIFHKDRHSVYVSCNENYARDLMIKPEEIAGKMDYEFFPKELAEKYRADDKRIITSGKTENIEEKYIQDGQEIWVQTAKTPVKDEKGNVTGILGIFWDITQRKRAEEVLQRARDELEIRVKDRTAELSRSNALLKQEIAERKRAEEERRKLEDQLRQAQKLEAIGTLAGGIAHDFNNLLMGIQGNVSLMMVDIDSTHPYYKRLKKTEKQIQSGARLTSHLLGYARKGRYEVKPVDLNQMLKEASETFGRTRKEVTIHQELAEDLLPIEVDSGQIEQVLLNLFVNAADAMPGGGDLILKTMNVTHKDMKGKLYEPKPGNYVLLTVTDTGTGMDKETMERIFEPFFTTKEMGRGTGLGMASAYGIIKGHGGYIDVESRKEQGATFSIYLPASERKVQEAVKTAEPFIKGTGTVLLVDDEEVILEVGKELLEGMGYRVLVAKDGKEAIEVYEKDRDEIDIVVLDMVMPNMGGGEAYDRMKEINPEIKVLLSSGFSIDGEATEILERGCDAFIQKPFKMKELSKKIRQILNKK